MHDIIDVNPLPGFRLDIRFDDGTKGEVDVSAQVHFRGVFAELRDPAYFRQVMVNPDIGTVCWPNGADLDPDVLYSAVTGKRLPGS